MAKQAALNDAGWRALDLPHDWSIEGKFSKDKPGIARRRRFAGRHWLGTEKHSSFRLHPKINSFISTLMVFTRKAPFG